MIEWIDHIAEKVLKPVVVHWFSKKQMKYNTQTRRQTGNADEIVAVAYYTLFFN